MFKSKSEEYEEFQQAVQRQIATLKSDNSHLITQLTHKLENKYQLQLLSLKESIDNMKNRYTRSLQKFEMDLV